MFSICQVKVKVLTKVKSVKRLIRVRTSIKSAAKKNKFGLWCLDFSEYILISPEREMECTQLFRVLGWIKQFQDL